MELLAPAGNLQSAYAAFKGGADAIYLGGKLFSARASADNFSNDEIKEIVFFAHSIGRKVYVTVNTILFQDEFMDAVEFCKFLYSVNIDGVIIQDLGLANYLHKVLPDLPLNASTQINCHNVKQAKALIDLGFKRIVLAREADLDMVKRIKDLGVEVEVFAHGALCVSYSGNCLLSSFIGNRSGNRGKCAQPCRMRYDLLEDGEPVSKSEFSISTKDLNTLDRIDELLNLNVDSIKIEGRLKGSEYIYLVSKAYRHAIDACREKKNNNYFKSDYDSLEKTYSRKFTNGYLFNESPFKLLNTETSSHQGQPIGRVVSASKNRIGIKLFSNIHRLDGIRFNSKEQFGLAVEKMFVNKNPVEEAHKGQIIEIVGIDNPSRFMDIEVIKTKDYLLNKSIEEELKAAIKVPVKGWFKARINNPIELVIEFNNTKIEVKGDLALKAENKGTTEIRIQEQLEKSGEYPYSIQDIHIDIEECFIPISSINKIRNEAFAKLQQKLCVENEVKTHSYYSDIKEQEKSSGIKAIVDSLEQEDFLSDNGVITYSHFNKEYKYENRVVRSPKFLAANELVNFYINKENDGYLIASQYCNIANSYALDAYFENGFNECILSLELDKTSMELLISDFYNRHNFMPNVGMVIYGKPDVMIMKSCPIGTRFYNKQTHCNRCHLRKYELKDRMSVKYRLLGDTDCNIRVLLDRPIDCLDHLEEIKNIGVTVGYLLITDEDTNNIRGILNSCWDEKSLGGRVPFRGHFNKRSE